MNYGIIPTSLLERIALFAGKIPIPAIDALYSIVKARSLMAGVQLGVFEALREGKRTAADVAGRLGLNEDALDLLLRTLVFAGYVAQHGDHYSLSRLGRRSMIAGGEMEMFGFVLWNYTHWEFMSHLEEMVRTGRGIDFHETLRDAEAWSHYQRAMFEVARLQAPVVAAKVPVPKGARLLLDLAGSHGLFGATLCRRHAGMRSIVLDLPAAIEHARGLARAERIDDVVEHRAGDLRTDDLGSGYDVILLCSILHHFRPDENRAILGRVCRALNPNGTVAIWEIEAPAKGSTVSDGDGAALFFRLTSTAAAYGRNEYADWLASTGFTSIRAVRPALTPGNVLVTGKVE